MAEFPNLGKHCEYNHCNMLDFLPMKCDACTKIMCSKHIMYDSHECTSAFRKNVQVPVCPLCNKPVPTKKGESPDTTVGAHIDRDCQSDPRKRIYSNRCSLKSCKQKELVPVLCNTCKRNFW
uniref:AN1-type domain-containing protein n=1 Tax=Acrobeloides nanus TaxID=290746 RepID=A0A914DUN1_9BILA